MVPDTIAFHDIAGLVAGAHRGEGLGNQFLANIRETDAIVHVVRVHDDPNVVHPEGRVDPLADIETIETELIYADLEQAERRLERVRRPPRAETGTPSPRPHGCGELIEALQAGRPARTVPPPADAARRDGRCSAADRQAGPVRGQRRRGLGRGAAGDRRARRSAGGGGGGGLGAAGGGAGELDAEEAAAMRADLGLAESGLEAVVRGAFELLELIAFFTAGEDKPAQSWHLRRGLSVWHAAGMIHSDIQRGFVRAEVVAGSELVDAGGYAGARERGALRLEGRDYVVADGDVITVKFTP